MEVVVTAKAISQAKLKSNHHHQQTNTQVFQARCPSCRPTNSEGTIHAITVNTVTLQFGDLIWETESKAFLEVSILHQLSTYYLAQQSIHAQIPKVE